jgi:riboflavin biosynthesis pyrimidine reductase
VDTTGSVACSADTSSRIAGRSGPSSARVATTERPAPRARAPLGPATSPCRGGEGAGRAPKTVWTATHSHAALERAREAAGGKDVRVGGGVSTIRQYLREGLIDELHLALSPVLLGRGEGENATHVTLTKQV